LLDINTSDGGAIRFNNFWNRTDRDGVTYDRNYPVAGSVNYGIRDSEREIQTINNSLAGENYLGRIKINWGVSHAFTSGKTVYDHELNFQEGGASKTGMMNVPQEDLKGPGEILMDYAYNNWPLAYLNTGFWRPGENKDRDLSTYLDLERTFNLTDNINVTLKTGAKYRFKDRNNVIEVYRSPYWVNRPKSFKELADGSIVPADFSNTSFADPIMVGGSNISMLNFLQDNPPSRGIFDGKYIVDPLIDADLVREWYDVHKDGISQDGSLREYARFSDNVEDNYSVTERISSGYGMATINLGSMIRVIGGVRFEKEKNDYTAKWAPEISGFFTYDPTTVSDTTASYSETYVLPNFHIRFKPVDWFDIRFAATKSLARPNFTMRLPTLVVERTRNRVDRGNPDLKTTEAWNYDLIASLYDTKYGLFTVGVFQKKLDNIFYNLGGVRILNSDMEATLNLPEGYGNYIGFSLNEPVNTQGSEVKGIEFDLQANLGFLPGFLGNFVFRGNFTKLQSVTYIPRFRFNVDNTVFPPIQTPEFYETEERLEGQPSDFGNLALGYDQGGFSGRLSVFFQDDYPTSVTSTGLGDTFQKGYSKWDLALKQEIKKYKAEIMLNVTNLTNMYEGTYYKYNNLDRGSRRYDMLVDLGIRFTL
jgi:TonB-dependent receptor